MNTDATAGRRMAEFARGVEVLRERPRHVQGADFAPPPPSWAAAVDAAAALMEPHWDRFWSKPTDSDALTALAIITYAIGGGEQGGDAVREMLTGLHIHDPNRQLLEPRLVDAVCTAMTATGHDLNDAQDPVVAAWKHLTADRTKEWMSAPEFVRETSFPEMFGEPGPASLLFRALPTITRAIAAA